MIDQSQIGANHVICPDLCSYPHPLLDLQEFLLKVRCQHTLSNSILHFVEFPETSSVKFITRTYFSVIYCTVYIHQLTLPFALKDIALQKAGRAGSNTQFFAHLPLQCCRNILAPIDMPTDGRIPLARLYLFPQWTELKIKTAAGIEQMQMDHRMQQSRTTVTLATRSTPHNIAGLINHRQQLCTIITLHKSTVFYKNMDYLLFSSIIVSVFYKSYNDYTVFSNRVAFFLIKINDNIKKTLI